MGLLDLFKKRGNTKTSPNRDHTNNLLELKRKMFAQNDQASVVAFNRELARVVNQGVWVHIPANDAQQLMIECVRGLNYIVFFSSPESLKKYPARNLIITDVNKVIDIVYSDPDIWGLVLDPNDDPVYIDRKRIHFLTERKDPRLEPKDWGGGIPAYKQTDILTALELLDFAMENVELNLLQDNGYQILEKNISITGLPNFALRKDGQLYFMKVCADVYPNVPTIDEKQKPFYFEQCKQFDAKLLLASATFKPKDPERAEKGLALTGDIFDILLQGIKEITE